MPAASCVRRPDSDGPGSIGRFLDLSIRVQRDCFGAGALLLGVHHGEPFERDVPAAGARPAPLGPWMPGQRYFVR